MRCKVGGVGVHDTASTTTPRPPQGTTATPALLQLPTTLLASDSSGMCRKWSSRCLILAISYTCFMLSVPAGDTLGRPVSPEPVSMPAAVLIRCMVGGDLVTKVKVRSGWIVMRTGVGVPATRLAVRAASGAGESQLEESGRGGEGEATLTVEILDKVDALDTPRTECRTDRRSRRRLARRDHEAERPGKK